MEKTYDIKNLECAHCGGKIEAAMGKVKPDTNAAEILEYLKENE